MCNELGLIGGETFAEDGLRLPSNASIEKSGTKKELEKCEKMGPSTLRGTRGKTRSGRLTRRRRGCSRSGRKTCPTKQPA